MHWKRFCLVSLSLAWMAFPARVRAQDATATPGYSSGYATVDNLSGAMTLTPGGGSYLLFNKQTGPAVGIPTGYSRIGIRHAIFDDGPNQVFGEAELLITDSSRYGFNTGLGYRTMIDGALWGVNGWYDTIQSPNAFTYQQAGAGFEYLSDTLDVRANGYIPFGNRENFLKVTDPGTVPVFRGHDFSTLGTALFQQALAGWDAEAGVPMPVINWLRAYAGVYYLTFKGDETWGVRGRMEGRITQGATVMFQVSNDQQFGTNLNVGVDIRFDGRLPTRFGNPADAYARRYDQVRRQWQVQLGTNKGDYAVPLNNPTTGDKIQVTWVNNTSGGGGNGTFEHPYNVLPSHVPSDYVLVKRGVGDTVGNIALQDGQSLFGEGKQHFINTDRLGLTPIPDNFFDNSGGVPSLLAGNPNAPVVTLADNTVVSAFNITGGTTAAIAGSGIDNFLVECVNVTSASGLSISDAGGVGIVRDSTFTNTSPGGVGISITNTSGPGLNLSIDNVDTSGGAIGTSVRALGAPVSVNLTNYTGTAHTNAGIVLDAVGTTLGANVSDVNLTNVGDGLRANVSGGGSFIGNVSRLTATGSGNLLEGNVNTGAMNLQVTDATLSGSTGGSGVSLNLTNATGVAVFDNLTADGNAVDGEQAVASGATDYRIEIHNSSLAGNADDATDNDALAGANLTVIVDPTDLSGSGNNAVEFRVDGAGSHLTKLYTDVDATNSGNDGVNGTVTNGGRADVVFVNSPASNSGHNGLNLVADNNSTIAGSFTDGSFSQSGNAGGHVESTNGSTVGLTFNNTPMANNGAVGFEYVVNNGSLLSAAFNNGDLSGNPVNNVVGTVDGAGSRAILNFDTTNANLQAANGGFVSDVTNGGALYGNWLNSNISGTQGDGVRVNGSGAGSVVSLNFNNSLIENNQGSGLIASLTGGDATSSLNVELNGSTLIGNADDGLNVTVDGTDTVGIVNINGTPVTGNAHDGFQYLASGGAHLTATAVGAGNDFSDNGFHGINGTSTGAGTTANVTIANANVNNSGGSGVLLITQDQAQQQFALSNSSVSNSGSHGIEALADTDGQLGIQLTAVTANFNQRNGITIDAVTGGDVTGSITGSSFSFNGQGTPSSGVRLNVNGAGSSADLLFNTVAANSNTQDGLQLQSSGGGSLTAKVNSGLLGASQANNNAGDGIQLTANGAGSVANLLMFGDGTTNGNGGNGLNVAGTDAQQVAVQFTGSSDGNALDGVHVALNNVANAALEITSTSSGSISNNGGDGIDISLTNTDLTDLTVQGTLVESLHIAGLTIENNGGAGVRIQTVNSNLGNAVIENNTIQLNAGDGIAVDLSTGGDLSILNNNIWSNGGFGIHVTQDSNTSAITIDGNSVVSNTLGNIIVDLNGTAVSTLHIDNNVVDGDGVVGGDFFNTGLNFLGSTINNTAGFIPPDTMGAVGTNQIVEALNGSFAIYDKSTGNLLSRIDLAQFWANTGAPFTTGFFSDPRVIYDPTVDRWFMSSVDIPAGNGSNFIYVAVSDSGDPTGSWSGFRFRADSNGLSFGDFDTLGIDDNAIHISTINFVGNNANDVSIFSIPKADLIGPNPTIVNLSANEHLPAFQVGSPLQVAVNLNNPGFFTPILAADDNGGNSLTLTNLATFANNTFVFGSTQVAVPAFTAPNSARQPGAPDVENDAARFGSNVVEVNGMLWAAHAVAGTSGNSAIRWYEIDPNSATVVQSGTIETAALDYYYPSIAVNDAGAVVIGFSGSGPGQFISSMAAYGATNNGVTTFQAPVTLAAGADNYNVTFGSGRNRWGDYSATVVDPTDPSKFWTFQERVAAANVWGVQITEIDYQHIDTISGTTLGDAIAVSVNDSAHLLAPSSIDNNTVTGHGGDGIRVNLNDNGAIDDLTINGNTVTGNAGNGIGFLTTGTPTLGNLSISGSADVSNNGGDGINVQLNSVTGTPNVTVDNNNVHDNGGLGIAIDGVDTSLDVVSVQSNTIQDNVGGDGLRVNLSSSTGSHVVDRVLTSNNTIERNAGDGIEVNLQNLSITTDIVASGNTVNANTGRGIFVDVLNTDINDIVVNLNNVDGNTGGAGVSVLLDNTSGGVKVADQIHLRSNNVTNNSGDGIDVLLNNISNVAEVVIDNSLVENNLGGGVSLIADNSATNLISLQDSRINGNTGGDGFLAQLTNSPTNILQINRNRIENNNGDGVNLDLDNSSINNLVIQDNIGPVTPGGIVGFQFDVFQEHWELSNLSPVGTDLTQIQIDLAPAGLAFVTSGANFAITDFENIFGGTATGWTAINGVPVDNTLIVQPLPGGGVNNGDTLLTLDYNDFQPAPPPFFFGELHHFDVLASPDGGVSVHNTASLTGTVATATFSNGLTLSGVFQNQQVNSFTQTVNASSGGIANNTGEGIRINAQNGSNIGAILIDGNRVDGNGLNGIDFLVDNSTLPALPDRIQISNNEINSNAGSGISLVKPNTSGTSFGVDFAGNTITSNAGGFGIDIQLDDNAGSNFESSFTGNTISSNSSGGVNLALSQNIVADVTDFSGNTVSNNLGVGLRLDATDNAQYSLVMGASGHNTFDGNRDAGLGVTMNSNSQGQLTVLDSEFNNTVNGPDGNFAGEGVAVRLTDNAALPSLVIGDPVAGTSGASGNASHGVQIFVDGFSQLTNPTIQNMTINNNGGDGINIERRGLGVIDNFVINANSLDANAGDGFDIQARAGNLLDEYTITNNTINASGGRGIAFRVDGDADMSTELNGNTITNSGGTGITVDSTVNAVTDTPTFTGNWLASTITGNGGHGIDINSPNHVIQIGDATAGFPDTIISNNGGNGVLIRSTGTVDIDNAQINNNGGTGVLFNGGTNGALTIDQSEISGNAGQGVDLVMTGNTLSVRNSRIASNVQDGVRVQSISGVNDVTLTNNIMTLNGQDGLEIVNNSSAGFTATVANSQFTSNSERGVAIFNRGSGLASISLNDNLVVSNQQEGVYVVNTADGNQATHALATVAMQNGGLVTATPDLVFDMNRNTVSANGLGSAFTATGLVVRVGTADGGLANFTDNGGFADTRAGVTATVRDNILQGNAGSDVFFQSFVSTVNPTQSAGVWDNTTFALNSYQTDPLARLDLIYGNNVADSTDATTIGAAYTNDENVFKSRTIGQNPAGPFATGNRLRNAQRLADRDVGPGATVLAPIAPVSQPNYLYPGMGASTFRVNLEPGNVFGTGSGFLLDGSPFVDQTDYNGVGPLPELFGWGTLP